MVFEALGGMNVESRFLIDEIASDVAKNEPESDDNISVKALIMRSLISGIMKSNSRMIMDRIFVLSCPSREEKKMYHRSTPENETRSMEKKNIPYASKWRLDGCSKKRMTLNRVANNRTAARNIPEATLR